MDPDETNTAEARRLLAALEEILPLAEAVDAQRGHTAGQETPQAPVENPVQVDNDHGNDMAERLTELILRLRHETQGSPGRT